MTLDNGLVIWSVALFSANDDVLSINKIISNDSGKSNSFLMEIKEDGFLIYDRQGSFELYLVGEDDVQWDIYDAEGYYIGGSETLLQNETMLLSSRANNMSSSIASLKQGECIDGRWNEFYNCMMGTAGIAVNTGLCLHTIFAAKAAFAATAATAGGAAPSIPLTIAGVLLVCGGPAVVCFAKSSDDPPTCGITSWMSNGTKWIQYKKDDESGWINANQYKAKMDCTDDRTPCCVYNPGEWIYVTSGDPIGTAYGRDCGLNKSDLLHYQPYPLSTAELATFRLTPPATGEKICGDGEVTSPERCDPPMINSSQCPQEKMKCENRKRGKRDGFGDCSSSCSCIEDSFVYACSLGDCGAECGTNDDCLNWYDDCLFDCTCGLPLPWTYTGQRSVGLSATIVYGNCGTNECTYDSPLEITLNTDGSVTGTINHVGFSVTWDDDGNPTQCILGPGVGGTGNISGTHSDGKFNFTSPVEAGLQFTGTYDEKGITGEASKNGTLTTGTGKTVNYSMTSGFIITR